MLKNYFKTAWRNLRRNKLFSFINIIGLSIGISASLVIYLLVAYDLSFDKEHKGADRIYRVVSDLNFSGMAFYTSGVPGPMSYVLPKEAPGLEVVAPIYLWGDEKVGVPEEGRDQPVVYKKQNHIAFVDHRYFNLIEYRWLAGSPSAALAQPNQVVLTESQAKLYFSKLDPAAIVGKKLYFNDTLVTVVSGIVRDLPYHSDFSMKAFLSWTTLESPSFKLADLKDWGNTSYSSQLWVKLSPGTSPARTASAITAMYPKYHKQPAESHSKFVYGLEPLSELHFNHTYSNFFRDRQAHKPTLYSLLAVAAFLLLLACINFINLTTAQSSQRAREIGIRKTIGSTRRQLLFQFLSETFLLTLIAALLSVALTPFLLKIFADFMPRNLDFNLITQPGIVLFLFLLVILVSLLSGFYPAAVLSSYRPVLVLKNQVQGQGANRAWLRKTLTVSQFVIAQVFIIATLLVSKQIRYSLQKDLGFKKDAIVYFSTDSRDPKERLQLLLEKVKAIPGVELASLSGDVPSSPSTMMDAMIYKDGKKEVETEVQMKFGDTNYIKLFQIKLLAGQPLPYSDTTRGMLINETYAHMLGFQDLREAIGKEIQLDRKKVPVVGVIADFQQQSTRDPIKPLSITSFLEQETDISVSLAPQGPEGGSWKATIDKIGKAWSEIYPGRDFEYNFQDETIAKYYKSEQDIARLLIWATGLAVFISCLGLLGLVIYITNQRTKEIGIRKIVGASVLQLIGLLSVDFLRLIALAFLVAVPIAWWGAHKWLDNFADRTSLNWWIFAAGGLLMLSVAFVILLLRTFKAATANPVVALRSE